MNWKDTVAARCRYGKVAERIFSDANIIFEDSLDDYQGYANVFAAMPDGTFVHYEWTYGSCSSCDEWEARELDDNSIEKEMRSSMAVLKDRETARRYLRLDSAVVADMAYPSSNSPTNGSIPGMVHTLYGGRSQDFASMGKAFAAWEAGR